MQPAGGEARRAQRAEFLERERGGEGAGDAAAGISCLSEGAPQRHGGLVMIQNRRQGGEVRAGPMDDGEIAHSCMGLASRRRSRLECES